MQLGTYGSVVVRKRQQTRGQLTRRDVIANCLSLRLFTTLIETCERDEHARGRGHVNSPAPAGRRLSVGGESRRRCLCRSSLRRAWAADCSSKPSLRRK